MILHGVWLQWIMIALGIETSCDETGIGVVDNSRILASLTTSQIVHSRYGGVVPELAARNHVKAIMPLIRTAFEVAGKKLRDEAFG